MNSIADCCKDLKVQYDACFNTWFSEHFLRGNTNESMCEPAFKEYQKCVKDAMKAHNIDIKDVEKDVLGTAEEQKVPPKKS